MISTLYEPFRHWSEGGSVFILSDTHFDDADCKLMDPNWITPEEQVRIINSVVGKGDTFVCLGDVGDPKYVPMIKARKKILLLGNHDARGAYKDLFDEIYAGPLFISDKILLSHEPVYGLPWSLNIHGHDHNGMESYREDCKHINLAANVCGYTPVSLAKLIKDGVLADIDSIHRVTIDHAVERKQNRTKPFREHLVQRLEECPAVVEYTDVGYTIKLETDIYEGLNKIASEDYGVTIEELTQRFINWAVTNPEDFKKWAEEKIKEEVKRQ